MELSQFFYPSVQAHLINSFFMLAAIVFFFFNYSKVVALDVYSVLMLLMIASITLGVHALSHLGLEKEYGIYYGLKSN